MALVNLPTYLKMPAEFAADPKKRPYFKELEFILFQLWKRTGGGTDQIEGVAGIDFVDMVGVGDSGDEDNLDDLFSAPSLPGDDNDNIDDLFSGALLAADPFEVISVTADHTTAGNEILICNNTVSVDITLNPFPDDGEQLKIKRRDAVVNLIGLVDGSTPSKIISKNDGIHLVFTIDSGDWSVI